MLCRGIGLRWQIKRIVYSQLLVQVYRETVTLCPFEVYLHLSVFSFVIDSDLHSITTNYSGKLPYDEQHMVDAYCLYRVYVVAMNTCSNITAQNILIYSTVYWVVIKTMMYYNGDLFAMCQSF